MEEVYADRAEQVKLKHDMREKAKAEVTADNGRIQAEVQRLEKIDEEREEAEKLVKKRHQEELFRQMDFHQVQRHRQLQQHAIEQRQAAIAEEKIRRAVRMEKDKAETIMRNIVDNRKQEQAQMAAKKSGNLVAPWEK